MRLDRGEHVGEAPRHVRPDGFVLQRAGEREHLRLVGGNGEVVGPEMHQPLAEGLLRRDGNAVACGDLVEVVRRELGAQRAEQALRGGRVRLGLAAVAAQLGIGLEDLSRRRQAANLVRQWTRAGDLLLQPAARIAARPIELARAGAEAKTIRRNDCVQRHARDNG